MNAPDSNKLESAFASPPVEAQAWCWWRWLNGAVNAEGITRDLEAMRDQGIGGAVVFDAGHVSPKVQQGPAFMGEEWRALFRHAVSEADRCGIVLSVNLCSGWNAGGPWITPEAAAKKLTASTSVVSGTGSPVQLVLPQPPAIQNYYRDIAVLASPVEDNALAQARISASSEASQSEVVFAEDGNPETCWSSTGYKPGMGPTPDMPAYIQFEFNTPRAVSGCYLRSAPECGPREIDFQCSDDGHQFRSLNKLTVEPAQERVIPCSETHAKYFRLLIRSSYPQGSNTESTNVKIAEIALLSKEQLPPHQRPPARGLWRSDQAIDLTQFVEENGHLAYSFPAGNWKIQRIGYTLLDRKTHNPGSGPDGWETDPMCAGAMDLHFAETAAKLILDAGNLAGKTLRYFSIDSWEIPQPDWTSRMREEFIKRRGYDPTGWLPAVLGQTTINLDETKRFMQDYRLTVADLIAENYYGRMNDLTVKAGLSGTTSEAGGPYFIHWVDALKCQGTQAVPMGEFWKRNQEPAGDIFYGRHNLTVKQAASAAHIYGKPICQAEAFTSLACDFIDDPWSMKDVGDSAFCEGLTRMVFHGFYSQLNPDKKPGIFWEHIGTHLSHTLTWWPMSHAWLIYLSRCQFMLRQGLFVADFAYLQSEAIPNFIARSKEQKPVRPAGFDYDAMNVEVLMTRASVKEGRLFLPDGMRYRYLVLPHQNNAILHPKTLEKVNELAEAGVQVIGPEKYKTAIPTLRSGDLDSITRSDQLLPDVEFLNTSKTSDFEWIHRSADGMDIYFISNQTAVEQNADVRFRVDSMQPELWDAVSGAVQNVLEMHSTLDNRTEVPMKFAPRQSFFVVFRKAKHSAHAPVAVKNFPDFTKIQELTGPWTVEFDPNWFYPSGGVSSRLHFDSLVDWSAHPEKAVRHYSGIATYKMNFHAPIAHNRQKRKPRYHLDLGMVKNLARVKLNGQDLGILWTAPWRVDVSAAIKEKDNMLEIEVANLWPNRLIGDSTLPQEQRRTVTNISTYDAVLTDKTGGWGQSMCATCQARINTGQAANLLPSGLLGPVSFLSTEPVHHSPALQDAKRAL